MKKAAIIGACVGGLLLMALIGERVARRAPVTIFAVGDIMLDRTVRFHIEKDGADYPFSNIPGFFAGADIAAGNLEGGFTDNASLSMSDHSLMRFTFDPSLASELKRIGFGALSLANNHAHDFGTQGYASTVKYLDAAGISSFGSPSNDVRLSTLKSIKGRSIAFIGYHEFYSPSVKSVTDEIAALRNKAVFIVVYPHWGVEYEPGFTDSQQTKAHAFIDAGADAVIGAHPHVIEPVEIYKGRAIFYSLGNFVFDQDFSVATRQGLTLKIAVTDKKVSYELVPVTMLHSKLSLPASDVKTAILGGLSRKSDVSADIKDAILSGTFSLGRNIQQ